MRLLILIVMVMIQPNKQIIFDFNLNCDMSLWYQTNDTVMGGLSNSHMKLDDNGNGVFYGKVSTQNNGGFAMTRLSLNKTLNSDQTTLVLELTGDSKSYQMRIKSDREEGFWFVQSFKTSGSKETIVLPLKDFYASYRGTNLEMDNFSANKLQEIAFLIGNKKNESFELLIDKIYIK